MNVDSAPHLHATQKCLTRDYVSGLIWNVHDLFS